MLSLDSLIEIDPNLAHLSDDQLAEIETKLYQKAELALLAYQRSKVISFQDTLVEKMCLSRWNVLVKITSCLC